ncbi:unnamed protein product [Camellia sinensis]
MLNLNLSSPKDMHMKPLPIETVFTLPSLIPTWPPGEGFASGTIDLGGLQVCQVSSFTEVWSTRAGGPGNSGATFFEPSETPQGFFMLGFYAQPNNKPLRGWVLAGKDVSNDSSGGALKRPIDYTLVWNSESLKIKQDGKGYFWLPMPPDGYEPIGLIVTNLPVKPSLDKIRVVRSDFTETCQNNSWIWGPKRKNNPRGFGIYSVRPVNRGTKAFGVSTGTFMVQNSGNEEADSISLACLKNAKSCFLSCMPNLNQIKALVQAYSPYIYFHPSEKYLPSSVNWFFENSARLHHKRKESVGSVKADDSDSVGVEAGGSNLPQSGSDDGTFWLDLPVDKAAKNSVKKGDLDEAEAYLHVKPMFGATFTDITIWLFYPFNGPVKIKLCGLIGIPLRKLGRHVGDWEHLTLRVSNFNGELTSVYFSQHSKGKWVDVSELEFQDKNKFVTYASLHGHAFYHKPGDEMQWKCGIGESNATSKSEMVMDTGESYRIVAAKHLGHVVDEPPWLNYKRKWGPQISCVSEKLKGAIQKVVKIPNEVFGEEGPLGPKMKGNWSGDEDTYDDEEMQKLEKKIWMVIPLATLWSTWKHRNDCVFSGSRPNLEALCELVKVRVALWFKASKIQEWRMLEGLLVALICLEFKAV